MSGPGQNASDSARADGGEHQAPLLRHRAAGDQQQERLARRAPLEPGERGERRHRRGRAESVDGLGGIGEQPAAARGARPTTGIAASISALGPERQHHRPAAASASASARSSRRGDLEVARRVRHQPHGHRRMASTSAASSVAPLAAGAGPRVGLLQQRAGEALRRLRPPEPVARDGAPDRGWDPSAAASLSVSLTGTAATAPSPARAWAITASITPRSTNGRAPSCTSTTAQSAPERAKPGRHRVAALAPAGHDRQRVAHRAAAQKRGRALAPPRAARTTTTWATSGWLAKGRSARSSIGTPAIGRYCLGSSPPIRVPRPAATTTTPTSRGKRAHQLLDVVEADQRDAGHLRRAAGGAEHPAEAEPRRLGDPPLDRAAGPDLAAQPDLAEEDDVRRRGPVVQAARAAPRPPRGRPRARSAGRPAVTCTKTSRSANEVSARRSSTASSTASRLGSSPVATRCGVP